MLQLPLFHKIKEHSLMIYIKGLFDCFNFFTGNWINA